MEALHQNFVDSVASHRIRGRISTWPSCGHEVGYMTPAKAMHAAGVKCDNCDRFIKWLSRTFVESLNFPQRRVP